MGKLRLSRLEFEHLPGIEKPTGRDISDQDIYLAPKLQSYRKISICDSQGHRSSKYILSFLTHLLLTVPHKELQF